MAAMRARLAVIEGEKGYSKVWTPYRRKMYNHMIHTIVDSSALLKRDIHWKTVHLPSEDWRVSDRFMPLRLFYRSFLSKSNNLEDSVFEEEEVKKP